MMMTSALREKTRRAAGMLLALYAVLIVLAPVHDDHGQRAAAAAEPAGLWPEVPAGEGDHGSAGPWNDCRLCSWSRLSLRPAGETAPLRADTFRSTRLHDVPALHPRSAPGSSILLRAPPSA